MDPKLLEILVCPVSKGPLVHDSERRSSSRESARLAYPIRDGIPVMLEEEARKLDARGIGSAEARVSTRHGVHRPHPGALASTRLPGKPLADIAGKPMVVRVAERARASGAARVVVATDDARDRRCRASAHGFAALHDARRPRDRHRPPRRGGALLGLAADDDRRQRPGRRAADRSRADRRVRARARRAPRLRRSPPRATRSPTRPTRSIRTSSRSCSTRAATRCISAARRR